MTTLNNLKLTNELNWLLNNSKSFQVWEGECEEKRFDGNLPLGMVSKLWKWFLENKTSSTSSKGSTHFTVTVGMGSLNCQFLDKKGSSKVSFSSVLGL